MTPPIKLKRAYDPPEPSDGYRVLVDRIWPRGVSRAGARIDEWVQDLAPSTALRKWFGHDPARWDGFRDRYARELDRKRDTIAALLSRADPQPLTLVFAARDTTHNNAVALKAYMERCLVEAGYA